MRDSTWAIQNDPEMFANLWRWQPATVSDGLAMKRITGRFVLLIATAAVLPLLVYGLISVSTLTSGTEQSVGRGNQAVAQQIAAQIKLYFDDSHRVLASIADADPRHAARPSGSRNKFSEIMSWTFLSSARSPCSMRVARLTRQQPRRGLDAEDSQRCGD